MMVDWNPGLEDLKSTIKNQESTMFRIPTQSPGILP